MFFDHNYMLGMHWLWWIVWLLIIAAVVWTISKRSNGEPRERTESPEQVLRRRYASGEISAEEYRERLRILRDENDR